MQTVDSQGEQQRQVDYLTTLHVYVDGSNARIQLLEQQDLLAGYCSILAIHGTVALVRQRVVVRAHGGSEAPPSESKARGNIIRKARRLAGILHTA